MRTSIAQNHDSILNDIFQLQVDNTLGYQHIGDYHRTYMYILVNSLLNRRWKRRNRKI